MSKSILRGIHGGHGNVGSASLSPRRVGIPHRVMADIRTAEGDEVILCESDILEVIHRWDAQWWTVILDEEDGLISSELLEPLSGSVDMSLFSADVSDTASSPLFTYQRKLVALVPHQPTGSFANLENPPVHALPQDILAQAVPASAEAEDLLASQAKALIMLLQVRALVNVTATEPGYLSYQRGDIIDVELRSTAEVWQGRLGSAVGNFRLDHTEPIVKERVRAIWDYNPASTSTSGASCDLTFKAGDIIEVCGPSGTSNWWFHGWMPSRGIGMFPFNFVESLEDEWPDAEEEDRSPSPPSPLVKSLTRFKVLKDVPGSESATLVLKQGDIIDVVERQSHDKWLGKVKSQTGSFVLDNSVEPIMTDRVKAIFSYKTLFPEELSFDQNDCITVVAPSDESTLWWYGTLKGRVGLFPFNYVELLPDERDPNNDSDDWLAPESLRALHSFSSKEKDVLNFDANDIIKVVDASSGVEWWTGELNGRRGLFPRTYCEDIINQEEEVREFPSSPRSEPLKPAHDEATGMEPSETAPRNTEIFVNLSGIELSQEDEVSQSSAPGLRSQQPFASQSMAKPRSISPLGFSKAESPRDSDRGGSSNGETLLLAERVRALHAWNSQKPRELVLQAGDIIQVLDRPWEHWWKGRLERNGHVGLFPTSFVEVMQRPRRPKRQSSMFESDEAVLSLRSNVTRLSLLLRNFDMSRDLAENAEIQDLFNNSCILRRKALRLLHDQPHDDDLRALDASFQEMKAQYDNLMGYCAKRALHEDANRIPRVPKSPPGLVIPSEPETKLLGPNDFRASPISGYEVSSMKVAASIINGGNTGGIKQRASLPPTPAPDSSSSEAWSSSLANMLDKRRSQTEPGISMRYSGRLSGLEADIKRAKKGYQESIRSQEEGKKPRRLPKTGGSIAVLRSVRDRLRGAGGGTSFDGGSDKKTIHLPRVEYIHNHVVYENQQPLRRQRD